MKDKKEKRYDIKLYEYLANNGDPFGYNMLGFCYYHGFEVKQNFKIAVEWYRKGVEMNHPPSMYNLALCFDYIN